MVKLCLESYPESLEQKYKSYFDGFSFPLSDFQKYAIEAIVEGHHVLVTAHTGSGKTLPAEFAIQHFTALGKKLIYTSPIKALSNQKYYEFSRKYPHISFGLFTGDIKTNPDAQVIIMTTEILMNSLFQKQQPKTGSSEPLPETTEITESSPPPLENTELLPNLQFQIDIETELACVIFDEVHYINDQDRGQVWEKTILMLPPHIQMVMLSATIDAPERFAEWCERGISTSSPEYKQVYLASTNHRVVPLTHYGFLTTTEQIFKGLKDKVVEKDIRDNTNKLIMLQNDKGKYQETGYKDISRILKIFENKQVILKRQAVLNNLALFLRDREMLPAIGFVFSRKHVELCANEVTIPLLEDDSKIPYTVRRECEQIVRKLPNYREYLELPEYNELVRLLERGIGIHHSGMIPILREIVELMISKKYIKLLFATESFAIGLDCPIKTAVFTGLTKFDGNNERFLLSHEYTQMAGRAGRRGIDTIGHVVHCNNLFPLPSQPEYKDMLCGKPQKLVSKFRISYSIILGFLGKADGDNDCKNSDDVNSDDVNSDNVNSDNVNSDNVNSNPISLETFVDFVNKSMIHHELQKNIVAQKNRITEIESCIAQKNQTIETMKIVVDICRKYNDAETKLKTAVNKKRKELEREIANIRGEYKNIVEHSKIVNEYDQSVCNLKDECQQLEFLELYITEQVRKVVNVLIMDGFVEEYFEDGPEKVSYYRLTHLGKIAASIGEIHPLVISKIILETNYFESFTSKQLIGLFSCFTDIKVPQDMKCAVVRTDDSKLKSIIEKMATMFLDIENTENQYDIRTGIDYGECLMYDIVDSIMTWSEFETEQECKYFIQQIVGNEKGISVGDFTKAVLKIATITKELMTMCERLGLVKFEYTLSKIPSMILKYITTTQSLYV